MGQFAGSNPVQISDDDMALQKLYLWEKTTPQRICMTQPMGNGVIRELTWSQMMDEVRRIAAHLQSFGFAPGSKIAILSKNCAHWMMSDFAIWLAGYVSVPLYPTLAAETIRQILVHSEARLVFIGKLDGWDAMKPGVPAELPRISYPLSPPNDYPMWDDVVKRTEPLQGNPARAAEDLATIVYTSGTTGQPKGVMMSFGALAWAIATGKRRLPLDHESRLLSYLPLAHVAERALIEHGFVVSGCHVFFADSLDTFAQDLRRARPTIFFSVPRLWVKFQQGVHAKMPPAKLKRLLRIPIIRGIVKKKVLTALGLDHCKLAAVGAAPIPTELYQWYLSLGLNLVEAYGMTENCAASHSTRSGRPQPGSVGPPMDGVECRIDPDTGEVQMKSPALMMGYYKQPELTAQTMTPDGWLRTGDKGQIAADGSLRLTGRVKDLFKTSKGKYVAPAPIEDRLGVHPSIEACCVAGANLENPVGIVMLSLDAAHRAEQDAERREILASLNKHLDDVNSRLDPHEQMRYLAVVNEQWTVENGLITPTFKVKRNQIEEKYSRFFEQWTREKKPVVWQSK